MIRRIARARRDDGATLVEMLVTIIISAMVGTMIITAALAGQKSTTVTQTTENLTAEGRTALNRMAGDLREALPTTLNGALNTPAITAVGNPGPNAAANALTYVTFNADFDGDGCISGVNSDAPPGTTGSNPCNPAPAVNAASQNPDTETFCWDPSTKLLYLIPGALASSNPTSCTASGSQAMVSGQVTSFELDFYSTVYEADTDGDGSTSWQELDAYGPPYGNKDGSLDSAELPYVNIVVIKMTVSQGGHSQDYQTSVNLRNVAVS